MPYLFNKNLPFIKENYPGNKFENGQFIGDYPRKQPSFSTILKWQLSRNPQKEEKKNDHYSPRVVKDNSIFENDDNQVVWLGHACFLLK
ncbi:hypothetical protein [Chondrinema litorale]|uniref:hypothetical protein n=1 Tax=Chondrinema litorale TaxID=2994555 RepID=UPI00254357B1|nr:hypothetical protein [Chondrinema litorale]UZR92897.1 hypothetical protein OQ292_13630 [Chondrinema litorale]